MYCSRGFGISLSWKGGCDEEIGDSIPRKVPRAVHCTAQLGACMTGREPALNGGGEDLCRKIGCLG